MMQQSSEPLFLPFLRRSAHAAQSLGHPFPLSVGLVLDCASFSLGRCLPSTIPVAPTLTAARKALGDAVDALGRRQPRAAALLDQHGEEILAVYQLSEGHRKRLRSTNMLERVNHEIKRRTRVIRIFPNDQACVRLVKTLMMELNQEWMERLYLRMDEATSASTETEKR